MITILFAGCEYFNEPITPSDQKSPFPFKPMPLPELSEEYRNFKVDNIEHRGQLLYVVEPGSFKRGNPAEVV